MRTPWAYWVALIGAVGLWVAALFAPYDQPTFLCRHWVDHGDGDGNIGLRLAEWGWLGPLGINFAWYANPLLIWMGVRIVRSGAPGRRLPVMAFALACTALLPAVMLDFEQDGRFHCAMVSGPAVWLWIAAFAVLAVASRAGRGAVDRQPVA